MFPSWCCQNGYNRLSCGQKETRLDCSKDAQAAQHALPLKEKSIDKKLLSHFKHEQISTYTRRTNFGYEFLRSSGMCLCQTNGHLNPSSAGISTPAECAALAGGKFPPPPANSRTRSRSELVEAVIESSQRVLFKGILKIFFKRSQARAMSGQMSKPSLFALSPTETGLITAANLNFA